ncbi:hypothetical protein TTHERM_00279840 (macronuclear) [Tetrahymena thermophila SB210]|uniref:Uncharacterized protein n=1 Tax=Tetrahymena thermophila (strain SB210) TaxID=312017 RepID=I7M1W2_TETTS|nr:hypothetical protein TTHERM_00279840 [Tetrahymena thermophila SB210]EAR97896.2 hypothetical protein TTHERM_00279840 [Tetrahymena thermophila SB210]|eukprot:XP_001018141.2 hypothetical protein TTHERM_00279840 [Tetrahymena thermophila SB210]
MSEFYSSYKHLFQDDTDQLYNQQLRHLDSIVQQSKKDRANSEKKRQIQLQKDLQIISQINMSPNIFQQGKEFKDYNININGQGGIFNKNTNNSNSILKFQFKDDNPFQNNVKMNRKDQISQLLQFQDNHQSNKDLFVNEGIFRNKQQYRGSNDYQVIPMQSKNRSSSIEELIKIDYPNMISNYTQQPQRKNIFLSRNQSQQNQILSRLQNEKNNNYPNIFKDPIEVPRLREIMLGDGMTFNEYEDQNPQDQQQRKNQKLINHQSRQEQLNYSPQNYGYSKKKKYLEFLGHNILNPMPQPSIEEISKDQRFNSYDSPEKNRKNKMIDQNDKQIKKFLQSSFEQYENEKNANRSFVKTPILEVDYNPNPLIYERIKSELNYNKAGAVSNIKSQNKNNNSKDNQPHQIESIHKGFDKYQNFKRKQKDFSLTPEVYNENLKNSPIVRRLAASRQIDRKDRVADLLKQDILD